MHGRVKRLAVGIGDQLVDPLGIDCETGVLVGKYPKDSPLLPHLTPPTVHQSASYPSKSPRMELDFILYGAGIEITSFDVPKVLHSDHLPLVCDFELR